MAAGSRARTLIEIFFISALAVIALTLSRPGVLAQLGAVKGWLTPAFLLYTPVIAFWVRREDFRKLGLAAPRWRAAGLELAVYAFIVLPGFLFSWWVAARLYLHLYFSYRLPVDFGDRVIWQFLGVALPEELFFRGWLQTRLNQLFGRPWKLFGAHLGPGLFIAALAFASAHLIIHHHPLHLIVFFPGLLFGLFRERSDSIFSPVLAHGLGNASFLLVQNFAGFAW